MQEKGAWTGELARVCLGWSEVLNLGDFKLAEFVITKLNSGIGHSFDIYM